MNFNIKFPNPLNNVHFVHFDMDKNSDDMAHAPLHQLLLTVQLRGLHLEELSKINSGIFTIIWMNTVEIIYTLANGCTVS